MLQRIVSMYISYRSTWRRIMDHGNVHQRNCDEFSQYRGSYTVYLPRTYCTEQSPSWESNRFLASQEISQICRARRLITAFSRAPYLSLSLARSILSMPLPSYFLKNHLNIIICAWVFQVVLSLRFPRQRPGCTCTLSHTCYMLHPFHSSRFDPSNIIWWGIQILKFLIM